MTIPFSHSPLFDKVRDLLPGREIYLVGGAVRDMLLNRLSRDLDFALPSNGISAARKVAIALSGDFMILVDERDTGRVIFTDDDGPRTFLDFATYRGADLNEDLRNRDFTFNAIAFDIQTQTLHDPLNGTADLRAKLIRACSPTSLSNDPIRILRAIRQAAEFECKIDLATRKAMKQAANLLPNVSPERKRDELFKILYASATYGDLERWWSQACTQCPEGLRPVLAYREDRAPWRFVLAYSALSGQGPHPPYGLTVEMSLAAFVGLVQRRLEARGWVSGSAT